MYRIINSKGDVIPYGPFESVEQANAWMKPFFGQHASDFQIVEEAQLAILQPAEPLSELEALRAQVATLTRKLNTAEAALTRIYDDADYMLQDQYDDDERTHRYFKQIVEEADTAIEVIKGGYQP